MLEQLSSSSCLSYMDSQSGSLFLHLINYLFASQCSLKNPNLYPPDSGPDIQDGDHFDFIVIGAGSAGSVVTTELTKSGKWKVLVLEAGGYPSITTEIPKLFLNNQLTNQTWPYQTEPSDSSCLGLTNGSSNWSRGKVLGGSSSINAMLYIRGNKKNYDSWAKAGNPGWEYENVMSAYKKNERLMAEKLQYLDSYGKHGLLKINNYKVNQTIRKTILESVKELGYPVLEAEEPIGFFDSLQTINEGTRQNSAKAFLGSVSDSSNLTLAINSHVTKILIDQERKVAQGVEVKVGDRLMKIYANKEVILSAGSLNSPQILMLSGIGPKEHLEDHGIEVIKDLKVGYNLQDHLIYWVLSKVGDEALSDSVLEDELYKYFGHRQGEFSETDITNINGFINTRKDSNEADIQYTYMTIKKNDTKTLNTMLGVFNMDSIIENLKSINTKHHILITVVLLLQPKSRGRVLLKSKDPFEYPIIRTGYLTDEEGEDIETMLRGIRFAEAQLETDAFKKLKAEKLNVGIPNCKNLAFASDDYYRCAVRNLGTTLYHATCTCKMGPKSDKGSVVDSRLKVHDVCKLRVIDSSIMPTITSGNTNGPSMMIGRMGAQMIMEDHD